jgi:hypothetical protein
MASSRLSVGSGLRLIQLMASSGLRLIQLMASSGLRLIQLMASSGLRLIQLMASSGLRLIQLMASSRFASICQHASSISQQSAISHTNVIVWHCGHRCGHRKGDACEQCNSRECLCELHTDDGWLSLDGLLSDYVGKEKEEVV